MIDALASAPHYADHVSAVLGALPESVRGDLLTPRPSNGRLRAFEPNRPERPMLVASFGDLKRAVRLGRRRIAMMEHGAGQSYGGRRIGGDHGSYAGGRGRGPSSLFLHPGDHPAERDRRAYPRARVEVVGSPFLDTLPSRVGEPGRVVAFSFHFNGSVAPETKNAWAWAWPTITRLRDRFAMLGHAHPRLFPTVEGVYRAAGIEPVADFRDVCRRADVYVCDNSSTLFAFAATGRPVVVLNPPWYDRTVAHGLRFWDAATVGVQCDRVDDLGDAIDEALRDEPARKRDREAAVDLVYAFRSGAAKRAAAVLEEWADG
ncbi:MAG TPA: CDP-glycerol glycerophosphotransferase family protein [Solirubrobacterales bacterium]